MGTTALFNTVAVCDRDLEVAKNELQMALQSIKEAQFHLSHVADVLEHPKPIKVVLEDPRVSAD